MRTQLADIQTLGHSISSALWSTQRSWEDPSAFFMVWAFVGILEAVGALPSCKARPRAPITYMQDHS
mgnify:CR=1 FL=1